MNLNSDDVQTRNVTRRQQFESLTKVHLDAMWRTALRMTGDRDAADDLTQDACLSAYRCFDQFEQGTNYKAWIFRILTNGCRDYLRRENKAPFKVWDNDEVNATVACNREIKSQPEHHLQQKEMYSQATDAMAELRPDVRLIVCMSLLEGLSYQEISDVVDIPVGTVRSRLSRGRKQLQKLLHSYCKGSEVLSKKIIIRGADRLPQRNNFTLIPNEKQKC